MAEVQETEKKELPKETSDTSALTTYQIKNAMESREKEWKDKMAERAKKFQINDPNAEEQKKQARLERFATEKDKKSVKIGKIEITEEEKEKRNARAKKFGLAIPEVEEERRKARIERFGSVNALTEKEKRDLRVKRFKASK
eukprot:CAMPEP_0115034686 /NCGR_PEP_ID=MMETSP0216-20121206/40822_1 /TAXON_ID=223996 /ORGANISM="Protocruzia adherens, Strain Boccale" /LENGTH=141 /DNA_ID=CAMNT_0002413665 /DNA_START=26 /DNA_END=451 /DNA_ORIENTATION=+